MNRIHIPVSVNRQSRWRVIAFFIVAFCRILHAQEVYDDYVQEVLDEATHHDSTGESYLHDDEYYEKEERRRQQAEQDKSDEKRRVLEAEERYARDLLARQREEAFDAELNRMAEDARKAALKQKKSDARIVRRVLQAAERGDHYGVLGLRNMELRIAPHPFKLLNFELNLPSFVLFRVSPKAIRKAYRLMARLVHPDKNRDGRATEAFIAVENAASILDNEEIRGVYDDEIQADRKRRTDQALSVVVSTTWTCVGYLTKTLSTFRKVWGPFAVPIVIISFLVL